MEHDLTVSTSNDQIKKAKSKVLVPTDCCPDKCNSS